MFRYLFKNIWRRILLAIVLGILARVVLDVLFSLQYRSYNAFENPDVYGTAVLLTWLITETANALNRKLDRRLPWHIKPKKRLAFQILFQIAIATVAISGIRVFFILWVERSPYILLTDELITLSLALFIVLVMNLFDFIGVLLDQWRKSLADAEKYKKESAEFEFEMLRAQVNPHFLFNSLNTLSSLVHQDPDTASDFIRQLSDVYRHVLDNRKKELITLSEEISFIRSYVYLLEQRFGQKFSVEYKIEEEALSLQIAPLTLQMLIENAVKHNVISTKRPLLITIRTGDGKLKVSNNKQVKEMKELSTGMGLQNIKSRYANLSSGSVEIHDGEEIFEVSIPLI